MLSDDSVFSLCGLDDDCLFFLLGSSSALLYLLAAAKCVYILIQVPHIFLKT